MVPNLGFQLGFLMTWFKETDGSEGMTWANVVKPVVLSDNFTLGHIWISHILFSIVCIIVLWYIDNVKPGKFGVAQPLYFPFTVTDILILNVIDEKYFTRNLTGSETPPRI